MTHELLLAGLVQEWVREAPPDERIAAERAAGLAARYYAGGASVSEACWEARRFVRSWTRHRRIRRQDGRSKFLSHRGWTVAG
jgi:hypothetical protein